MKPANCLPAVCLVSVLAVAVAVPAAVAAGGAQHGEFDLVVIDPAENNHCTLEELHWDGIGGEVSRSAETPSGQGMAMSIWRWEATVDGVDTGYQWSSKGTAPGTDVWSQHNLRQGGFFVENSILQALSPAHRKCA